MAGGRFDGGDETELFSVFKQRERPPPPSGSRPRGRARGTGMKDGDPRV